MGRKVKKRRAPVRLKSKIKPRKRKMNKDRALARMMAEYVGPVIENVIANEMRAIVRTYGEWAQVNRATEDQVRKVDHQIADHNIALAAVIAFLEKQGFKVNPRGPESTPAQQTAL